MLSFSIPFAPEFYWGLAKITDTEYDHIAQGYDDFNKQIKGLHLTNEEIRTRARELTGRLESDINGQGRFFV